MISCRPNRVAIISFTLAKINPIICYNGQIFEYLFHQINDTQFPLKYDLHVCLLHLGILKYLLVELIHILKVNHLINYIEIKYEGNTSASYLY